MVSAGELELTATLDTSDFERGNRRVNQGLNNTQEEALSTNVSFGKLGSTLTGIATGFATLGAAGFSALTTIGLKSPVVADELAKIEVSTFELSNTIGKNLEPALGVFNELIQTIDRGLQGDAGKWFGNIAEGIVSIPLGLIKDVNNAFETLSGFFRDDEEKSGRGNQQKSLSQGFKETAQSYREEGFFGSISNDINEQFQRGEEMFGFNAKNFLLPSGIGLLKTQFDLVSEVIQEGGRKFGVLNSPD